MMMMMIVNLMETELGQACGPDIISHSSSGQLADADADLRLLSSKVI
jgi:hypothetical protein